MSFKESHYILKMTLIILLFHISFLYFYTSHEAAYIHAQRIQN